MLLESAATGWRSLRAADLRLLLLTIGSHADLENLLLLDIALNACGLLFLPGVMSKRLFVGRHCRFDFGQLLLYLRVLSVEWQSGNEQRGDGSDYDATCDLVYSCISSFLETVATGS